MRPESLFRRAEGLMPFPVTDRRSAVAAYPSLLTAGADEAEADTAQRIAADSTVVDTELHRSYRDVVADEHIRQSRLSRWQEQR